LYGMGGLLFSVGDIIREGAVYGVGFLEQDFVAVLLDTQVQHTRIRRKVVTNDNQIVTESIDCDHFPRGRLVQAGVMLSLLRKRFIGS
jgi:hypothetical protein